MTQIGRSSRRHTVAVPGDPDARISLSWAALSDTGYRRSVNEDSLLARSPIFAVADGMGGHTAGDFASTAVVTRLAEKVKADFVGELALTEALRSAVDDMTRGVGQTDLGTGTTVTGIALTLVDGNPYWLVFNIGDSRVYSYRDGTLEQLTVDHSIVQELLDAGAITPAEAEVHPHSNVITRAVGFNEDPVPDYFLLPIVAGSRLLVCSDGLTKELTEHGIRYFLGEGSSPLDAAQQLMDAALGNGGRDNVTVVVVDVLATPESGAHREGVSRRAARRH
ncbi:MULTISPECIES: PP2C family serine/threonine-protein phosphatase [Microbacteriaceae]|uniref:PP2C family protein-serine/threonine phosphatase n=1 Tax=Microbacteriaceae TaxID=85023 RepID=UPI0003664F0A|nr:MULTISPECIES: protein phosphatase 2C domain-containing protein [Microbacteriaceae]MDR6613152.1 protein phosphatase [Leifsonia sp. 1010]TDQ03663.1 protein phosphatase [Leifsonia sp. 115AMFTsu3.1]SDH30762.1 protein phosphatase [Leifsonia sp. 197AMF]SDJ03914.1 protein phosphatase [Leifsonia sp. 466MF]SDJ68779.1 protein phosphatase [Leifsonia sp. 157MF]